MLKSALALILTVCLTGCRARNENTITMGDWIHMIVEKAGIVYGDHQNQYYIHIGPDSVYYKDVQAAADWGILDASSAFETSDTLTREWTAFTLVNLAHDLQEGSTAAVKDINQSKFPKQVASAAGSGLMKTDARGMFHPRQAIDSAEAEQYLDQIIAYINNRTFEETSYEIGWNVDPQQIKSCKTDTFDEENLTAVLSDEQTAEVGDLLILENSKGQGLYSVQSSEGSSVELKEENAEDYMESFHFSGSTEINFENAKIYDGNGNLIQDETTGMTANDHICQTVTITTTQRFNVNGFDIVLKKTKDSATIEFSRKLINSTKIYGSMKISTAVLDYNMNSFQNIMKDSYWKFRCESQETLGVKTEYKNTLAGDFSKIDESNFLSVLNGFIVNKEDAAETELKLMTIHLPIPEIPLSDIVLDVSIVLSAAGKAEIVLTQTNEVGFEIRDGNFRTIKNSDCNHNSTIKADVSLTAQIGASLKAALVTLADIRLKTGAKAQVDAKVHLYHEDGSMETVETAADPDVAEELAAEVPDVLVCADVKGNYILDVELNSKNTLFGKHGYETKISFLDAKNAPLFANSPQHFENWQAVPQCTRKEREKSESRQAMETKGQIRLESYSMSIHSGQKSALKILALPAGYSLHDLTTVSSDGNVVSVDGLALYAHSSGSAVITVSTSDGAFTAACNVLVPDDTIR